ESGGYARNSVETCIGLPSRSKSKSILLCNAVCPIKERSSGKFLTSRPLNFRITSPFCRCASSAGESGTIASITALVVTEFPPRSPRKPAGFGPAEAEISAGGTEAPVLRVLTIAGEDAGLVADGAGLLTEIGDAFSAAAERDPLENKR